MHAYDTVFVCIPCPMKGMYIIQAMLSLSQGMYTALVECVALSLLEINSVCMHPLSQKDAI